MVEELNCNNKNWLKLIETNSDNGDILQSSEFGESKKNNGWQYLKFKFTKNKHLTYFLALERKTLFGKIWYIPKGPGITDFDDLLYFINEIHKYAAKRRITFIKIEPPINKNLGNMLNSQDMNLKKVKNIQPNSSTVIIDLKPDLDQIMASFKQRTRRSIRKAEGLGVLVKKVEMNNINLKQFYNLYSLTSKRAGFFIRPYSYYIKFWNIFYNSKMASLYFAKSGDAVVAAAIVLNNSSKALYKDGASDRTLMPEGTPYLLQWEIIKDLKNNGIKEYDLHGTPSETELKNLSHPLYNLGTFKTAFSNKITSLVGAYDIIINNKKYRLWQKFGLKLYQAWAHKIKKTTFY